MRDIRDYDVTGPTIDLNQFFEKDLWEDSNDGSVDFSKPVPKGTYDARVVAVEGPKMSSNGNPYLVFQFQIDDADNTEVNGRSVWTNLTLMEKTRWRVQQTFTALGKETGDTDYERGEFDGAECRIVVDIRPPQNGYAEKNEVTRVLPPADLDEDWNIS